MRIVFSALAAALISGLLLASASQASLLREIEQARELQENLDPSVQTMSKHYVEVAPGVLVPVKGAKERRQVRFARWVDMLSGDRLAVYEAEGFPRHRLREVTSGVRTELWRYPESGRAYVFRDGMLVETRRF